MTDTPLAHIKVQELLKEVQVDYTRTKVIEAAIASVTESLLSAQDKQVSAALVLGFARDLGVSEEKARLNFKTPESVEIVGSYALQTVAKPLQYVDIAIRIPKSCFHEKDYLNHRYHVKRALYLAVLKKYLAKCVCITSIKWGFFCEDGRKPVLLLFPGPGEGSATTKFIIRIIPTISDETFSCNKLAPSKNNVRDMVSPDGVALPTPHYNNSILEDMVIESTTAMLKSLFTANAGMKEAVLLLKIWCRQRGLFEGVDCMNGFMLTTLIVYLATPAGGNRINQHMTPLQMFRLTMESLGNGNVLSKGIFMETVRAKSVGAEMKKTLLQAYKVVMCSSPVRVNYASRMSKSAAIEFQEEALRTLEAMKTSRDEGFNALFITNMDFFGKFDYHVRVSTEEPTSAPSPSLKFLDEDKSRLYEQKLEDILVQGLGDRARLVRVIRRSCNLGLALKKKGLLKLHNNVIFVGICLNNLDIALRMADVGPSADNKEEAKRFRAFWGGKAELRRFKDATITETAVWECQGWQRHLIIQQIIEHVLQRHLSLKPESLHVVAGQLDFSLLERGQDPISTFPKLMEVYETFSKRLRGIEDLPLKVVTVHPVSPAFWHADVFLPQPHPLAEDPGSQKIPSKAVPLYLKPIEVMLQLEGSGDWPAAPVAIQKMKTAFCLQIAQSLQKKWGVGCVAAEDAVDIMMEGYVFRLTIMYDKDPTRAMVTKIDKQLGSISSDQNLLIRYTHSSLLQGLHNVYPAYGPCVRIAKRWIGSHLFAGALKEEVIELLVAYTFVHSSPHPPPSSRVTGFLRFLRLLINHDWALEPLVVDVNGDMTHADYNTILENFDAVRRGPQDIGSGPEDIRGPSMYIATAYDFSCKTWTHDSPSDQVLKRLAAYARSSAVLVVELIKGDKDDRQWLSIFRTPVATYDVLIEFHPECLPYPSQVLFPPKGLGSGVLNTEAPKMASPWLSLAAVRMGIRVAREHLLIGLNPVEEFVQELKTKFADVCTMWYDPVGSSFMGLTISATAFSAKAKSLKRKQMENGQKSLDFDTFLRDISNIGEGLVKSIHVSSARRKDL